MEDWTLKLNIDWDLAIQADFTAEALKAMAKAMDAWSEDMRDFALKVGADEVQRILREIEAAKNPTYEKYWTHEPVIGWRAWQLTGKPKTVLMGANGRPWRKRTMRAVHEGNSPPPHPAPYWNCGCGINAMKTKEGLDTSHIYGRVALTGVVHEYTNGYRAEAGEILDLYLVQDSLTWVFERAAKHPVITAAQMAEILTGHYKVPVTVVKTRRKFYERW